MFSNVIGEFSRTHKRRTLMKNLLVILSLSILLTACGFFSDFGRGIFPMGPGNYMISCGKDKAKCERLSQEVCPNGYESRPTSINDGWNSHQIEIRCR